MGALSWRPTSCNGPRNGCGCRDRRWIGPDCLLGSSVCAWPAVRIWPPSLVEPWPLWSLPSRHPFLVAEGFGWRGSTLVGSATLYPWAITAGIARPGALGHGLSSLDWGVCGPFILQPNPAGGSADAGGRGSGFFPDPPSGVLVLLWGTGWCRWKACTSPASRISPLARALGALAWRRIGCRSPKQALTAGLFAPLRLGAPDLPLALVASLRIRAGVALVRPPCRRRLRFFLRRFAVLPLLHPDGAPSSWECCATCPSLGGGSCEVMCW